VSTLTPPLFPGMLLDAASRFANDHAGTPDFSGTNPVVEMGWACTLVPEESGGVGGTLADLGAIVEGLATHGVHLPVVETCAVAVLLLQAAPEAGMQWLQMLCEGETVVAPLVSLSKPLSDIAMRARQLDIGYELSGDVTGVDVSLPATHFIIPAQLQGSGDIGLFLVASERVSEGKRYRTMEGRRGADFRLEPLTVPAVACLARGAAAREALVRAEHACLLLTGVDTVAALAALLQHTIIHLKERRQFGVTLSSFQVLRHRTSDMYVRLLAARGLLLAAFQAHKGNAPGLDRTLRLMKVSLAESARACAEAAIQMHGGMGVSEEVLATRLAQRLIASEFRYGDRLTQASRLLHAAVLPLEQGQSPAHSPITRSAP
jgi:alkylation response protein AidB-like acyl-CoA dehydrogenase